jgi:3-hydroxyacyl-[acyl-carrier-protein] dehydratase
MTVMTLDQIRAAIPHREPFLWLDEVVELTEQRIVARKFLSPDLDVFRGHYPDFPVLPGVLQCEACFQAGAILISQLHAVTPGQVPVVTRINNVKFRHMLRPGDTIEIEAELTERVRNAYFLTGKVSTGGQVAARLEFACTAATMEG